MDLQSDSEKKKFLCFFGPAYRSFCMITTLKNGVILIALFDILTGILRLIDTISNMIIYSKAYDFSVRFYFQSFNSLWLTLSLPFAIDGIKKISSPTLRDVSLYKNFKIFELFLIIVYNTTFIITDSLIEGKQDSVLAIIGAYLLFYIIVGAIAKTVWSADIRLKNNDINIVLYGESGAKIEKKTSSNDDRDLS